MYEVLVVTILAVGGVFLTLTVLIVGNKAWRETRDAWRRARRRELEPGILAYAHGEQASVFPALGGAVSRRDRRVVEQILIDHVQRVRGIERERLGRALDETGFVNEYLRRTKRGRWWTRADAAEKLGLAGAQRAVNSLIGMLEDEVYEVRLRAAKALGALGGVTAVRPLIAALREPNRWSTIRIADVLATMGPRVVDELIEGFPELDRHARLAALDILGKIRPMHTREWLENRLLEEDSDIRARACHALGAIGNPESGPALALRLDDEAWPVRAMAAKALGRIQYASGIDELCQALRDPEWWVRANAAEALRLMAPAGIDALVRVLDEEDGYARHQAVLMLEEAGVLDDKVACLANGQPAEREAALRLVRRLVQIGQVGRLRELTVSHPDPGVRETLAKEVPPEREPIGAEATS